MTVYRNSSIEEQILILLKRQKKTKKDLAAFLGMSENGLKKTIDKGTYKLPTMKKIAEFLNVEANTLFESLLSVAEESATYQTKIDRKKKGVPVYNTDFTASDITQYDDEPEKVIGYVDLEGFRKCQYIVRVKGPSLEPEFRTGDYIGIEPVLDWKIIDYGQPYAITTKSKQKLVKIIRKGKDNDNLILRSTNPDFDDIDLHKDDIHKLFKVHGPIRDQWQ